MEDNVLVAFGYITIILMSLLGLYFIISYIHLQHFKSCYDINFQDIKCQKYLNY